MIPVLVKKYLGEYNFGSANVPDYYLDLIEQILLLCEKSETAFLLDDMASLIEKLPTFDGDLLALIYTKASEFYYRENVPEKDLKDFNARLKTLGLKPYDPKHEIDDIANTTTVLLVCSIGFLASKDTVLMNADVEIISCIASYLTLRDLLRLRTLNKHINGLLKDKAGEKIPYTNHLIFNLATSGFFSSQTTYQDAKLIYFRTIETEYGKNKPVLLYKLDDIDKLKGDGTYFQFAGKYGAGFNGRIYCPDITPSEKHTIQTNMTWVFAIIHAKPDMIFIYSELNDKNFTYFGDQNKTSGHKRCSAFGREIAAFHIAGYTFQHDVSTNRQFMHAPAVQKKLKLQEIMPLDQDTFAILKGIECPARLFTPKTNLISQLQLSMPVNNTIQAKEVRPHKADGLPTL